MTVTLMAPVPAKFAPTREENLNLVSNVRDRL